MLDRLIRNVKEVFKLKTRLSRIEKDLVDQRLLSGKLFKELNKNKQVTSIHEVEFKVFSQYGDDGIINYLVSQIDIPNKVFVEFGVQNYTESNTRFLLIDENWSGIVMDGSKENIQYIKQDPISRRFDLKSRHIFITAENINEILQEEGVIGEIGLLSIDIDGNDYWVWKAINTSTINPIIVVSEYNSVFGFDKPYTVPYSPSFYRTDYHHSNLCYGSSLLSLCDLAGEKGYSFIGCNSMGNNAYFVRKDKLGGLFPSLSAKDGYVLSKFSESKNQQGVFTFIKGEDRINEIKGVEVFNTRLEQRELIK